MADAYTAALAMLGRRELSVAQLRQRLARRAFDADVVESVVARLVADGSLDDRRVALAYARLQAGIKGRGRRRVLQAVQQLGIAHDVAAAAVAEVYDDVDEEALLQRAIARRLKGADVKALDVRGRARLVRQLVTQGYELSRVLRALDG